jgi:hypothetical protein
MLLACLLSRSTRSYHPLTLRLQQPLQVPIRKDRNKTSCPRTEQQRLTLISKSIRISLAHDNAAFGNRNRKGEFAGKPVCAAILDFRDGRSGSERLSDRRKAVPRCKLAARYSGACASARM